MPNNLLVLCPSEPQTPLPTAAELIEALRRFKFLGEPLEVKGETHYRPGEDYLRHITYLGCSPVIAMGEPGATGDEFCHIELIHTPEQIRFLSGDNMRPPRCPGCNYVVEEWATLVDEWSADPDSYRWRCPMCGQVYALPALNWRQRAGFGHLLFKIYGVFESEAVPSDMLMAELKRISQNPWSYFYLRRL